MKNYDILSNKHISLYKNVLLFAKYTIILVCVKKPIVLKSCKLIKKL